MTKRLDWEKAKKRDKQRNRPNGSKRRAKRARASRQQALAAFVHKHGIACFKCGATDAEWAKTGFTKRGPWAICTTCVSKR